MPKKAGNQKIFVSGLLAIFAIMVVGVVVFKTELLDGGSKSDAGLSGLVSVRGAVSLEDLNLSGAEVATINKAVNNHRSIFTHVELTVNMGEDSSAINKATVLEWSLKLDTNGDCEVRSWERKVQRGKLVAQLVSYMGKAANEYKDFKRFPDVQKKFKTLYI